MKKISLLSFVIIFLSSCSIQKTVIQYTEFPITEGEWLCKIRKSKSFSIGTDDVVSNRFGKRFYFDFTLHYDVFVAKNGEDFELLKDKAKYKFLEKMYIRLCTRK